MASEIYKAIQQICEEKNIPLESVLETIEAAMAVAYRKDYGNKLQNIKVDFEPKSGAYRVFDEKTVVEKGPEPEPEIGTEGGVAAGIKGEVVVGKVDTAEKPKPKKKEAKEDKGGVAQDGKEGEHTHGEEEEKKFNPKTDITLEDAHKVNSEYKIGDVIRTELTVPGEFGRMAAQTAKQVIIQKLREAERENLYREYSEKTGQIVNGMVQRVEGKMVLVDLGQAIAVMPPQEQVRGEVYRPGQRLKICLVSIDRTNKGPEIVASRAHTELVKQLFTTEVPEIASGVIEIKAIAREAGSRSKVAVYTAQENIDPIGSCVGQRGTRVQTIISELGGEKIDIIEWSDDAVRFIMNALSPAKVLSVRLIEDKKTAIAEVKEDQLSLAIGKAGQNVRLASQLTGWRIDVVKDTAPVTPAAPEEKKEETGAGQGEEGVIEPSAAGHEEKETPSENIPEDTK